MTRILHIIPDAVLKFPFQGSFKDVAGRIGLFGAEDAGYRRITIPDDDPGSVDHALQQYEPTHVLIEYSYFRRIVQHIRDTRPSTFIAVRAINIEPLQLIANNGLRPSQGLYRLFKGALALLWSDISCRRFADAVYAISEWEAEVYWRWLPGSALVTWLPYFTPRDQIAHQPQTKRDLILCVPGFSGRLYRRSTDMVRSFVQFASEVRTYAPNYEFIITGDFARDDFQLPDFIDTPGLVEDFPRLLAAARAVAMLSPIGYGFKTTIADGIANGCWPLLHPLLYRRCPTLLREDAIEVRLQGAGNVRSVLGRIQAGPPDASHANRLRDRANAIIASDFGPV